MRNAWNFVFILCLMLAAAAMCACGEKKSAGEAGEGQNGATTTQDKAREMQGDATTAQNGATVAQSAAGEVRGGATKADAGKVTLALLPTMDCLPFYYAAERGFFAQQGLDVKVLTFTSQWDCDTAITGRTQAIGATDLVRVATLTRQGHRLTSLQALEREYRLMVCGKLRLRTLAQLRLHTVGASRRSAADYWWREAMAKAGIPIGDALRPQINALPVRTAMLDENQLDAALLPEPYATKARLAGHKQLWQSPASPKLACLAALSQSKGLKEKYAALRRAYNMAADTLNQRGREAVRSILQATYKIPAAVVDSLAWPKFSHAAAPTEADTKAAQRVAAAKQP